MEDIDKLAEALHSYCEQHSCRRCFFKELCDKYFATRPAPDDWASEMEDFDDLSLIHI